MPQSVPQQEYQGRLALREAEATRLERRHRWLGNARVVVFALALVALWPTLVSRSWSAWWLVPPLLVFGVLVAVHGPVIAARARNRLSAAFHRRGLARLRERLETNE